MTDAKKTELTPAKAREIIGAIARLAELGDNIIVSSTVAAERESLKKWLGAALVENAGEIMGCWVAIRQEYEPLVNALAGVLPRALLITQQRQQRHAPPPQAGNPEADTIANPPGADAAPADAPKNVVPLT